MRPLACKRTTHTPSRLVAMLIISENGNSTDDSSEEAADHVVELETTGSHVLANLQRGLVFK